MSVWQQMNPRSGDHLSTSGGAGVVSRKHTLSGPNMAPLLNTWRCHVWHPGALVTSPEVCKAESISWRSSGEAWVDVAGILEGDLHGHEVSGDLEVDTQSV